jgi:hypothetical protein
MAAKKLKLPIDVTIGGVRRHVVHMTTKIPHVWTELETLPDGRARLVHHVGKLLLDGQTPTKLIEKPRPCSICKTPTYTTTMRGRPIHDTCEGWGNVMPDELEAQVIFGIAVDLNATIITRTDDNRPKEPRHAHRHAA